MSTRTRMLSQIQGAIVTAPVQNAFTATGFEAYANDAAFVTAHGAPSAGQIYWNTTEKCLREYNGTAWQYDKATYLVATDSTTTGSAQSITPAEAQIIRFTQGSLASINNIVPTLQKLLYLVNDQASQAITITNDSGGTAANRIQTGNGQDFVLKTNQILGLVYDNINSRWRVISRPITGIEAFASDAAFVTAHGTAVAGDRYWNTTDKIVREHDGTSWANQKTLLSVQTDSSTTGAGADITPAYDQIIKFTNASLTSIRSINPALQKYLILINGTGVAVTIKNQDTGATGANRIITGTQNDISLANDGSLLLSYDTNSSRWRVVGGTGTGSASTTAVNYFTDPTCENTAVGTLPTQAVQYNDGATAVPIDGTGGSAVAQVTLLASQSSPIRGTQSFILAKDANNRQGVGYAFPFTIPIVDKGLTAVWSFEYQTDTNFVTGDAGIWLYDVTNGALITPRLTSISKADSGGKIRSDYALTSGTSYRWIIHIVSTNALAWNLKIDTMLNSTDPNYAPGPADYDDLPVTFTGTWISNTTYTAFETRRGNKARYNLKIALTGAPTSATLVMTMPTGRTINTAALSNTSNAGANLLPNSTVGINDQGTGAYVGAVYYSSATTFGVLYVDDATPAVALNAVTQVAPFTFANGDFIQISFEVPIVEFGGSATFGPSTQPEYVSSTTGTWDAAAAAGNTVYGQAGSPISGSLTANRTKVCRLQSALQAGDRLQIQYQLPSSGAWIDQDQSTWPFMNFPSFGFGAYISSAVIGSTDVSVTFNQFANPGTTYNSTAGAANYTALGYINWRLVRYSVAAWVGVSLVGNLQPGFQRGYASLAKIRLQSGNGYGSINNKIRRFSNVLVQSGVGITYADSATAGATFTCTEDGVYSFAYSDCFSAATNMGLSLNTSNGATGIQALSASEVLGFVVTPSANNGSEYSCTIGLSVGDVIRAHTDGTSESAVPARVFMNVQRVS